MSRRGWGVVLRGRGSVSGSGWGIIERGTDVRFSGEEVAAYEKGDMPAFRSRADLLRRGVTWILSSR